MVLFILKIIGIVLLSILGIVLLLLLAVLFVPIRYRLVLKKEPEEKLRFQGKIRWLLGAISAKVSYEEDLAYVVRIFGFPFIKSDSSEDKDETEEIEEDENSTGDIVEAEGFDGRKHTIEELEAEGFDGKKQTIEELEAEGFDGTKNTRDEPETEKIEVDKYEIIDEIIEEKEKSEKSIDEENAKLSDKMNDTLTIEENSQNNSLIEQTKEEEENRTFEKMKVPFNEKVKYKIKSFFEKICNVVKSVFYKCKEMWQNVSDGEEKLSDKMSQVWEFLNASETEAGKNVILDALKRLFGHILPRKWKGFVRFGMSNPANTGKILGVISVIYGLTGALPEIYPEFEQEILEVDLMAKGRIRISYLLRLFLNVWFDKNFKAAKERFEEFRRVF
ncbi:MAG: DUF2953 domain-containing protein [Lachnospiraceae bacterium]|nr:DUF2953 domain-containing protein [Lachnospiraceae bacterium]